MQSPQEILLNTKVIKLVYFFQYVVEKKAKTEQASSDTGLRHAEPSYDERGFNEHGQR